jgi:glycerol-3-phosphate acyltransferase PlsY
VVLDFAKGASPVLVVNYVVGLEGLALAVVAMAPILGHAYSPFLGFRGGKALAVTFGIWTGLSLWLVPTVLGLGLAVWLRVLGNDGRAVLAGMVSLLGLFVVIGVDGAWYLVWVGNFVVLGWKYRGSWVAG